MPKMGKCDIFVPKNFELLKFSLNLLLDFSEIVFDDMHQKVCRKSDCYVFLRKIILRYYMNFK